MRIFRFPSIFLNNKTKSNEHLEKVQVSRYFFEEQTTKHLSKTGYIKNMIVYNCMEFYLNIKTKANKYLLFVNLQVS